MKFILTGNLCREICDGCRLPLHPAVIRFYRVPLTHETSLASAAAVKDTLAIVDEKQLAALEGELVGEGKTDEKGQYRVTLNERYQDGPLRVVVEVANPDYQEGDRLRTVWVYITTLQPAWQFSRDQSYAAFEFNYCFVPALWCEILRIFDLWVICGRVGVCENPKIPVIGVKVTAMDADIITDDLLGSAITDANGRFQIYYRTADFKRTFLSPLINVETPLGGVLGPDVYFLIEAEDGTELLTETRADGKKRGRKDIGRCFCIDLCAKIPLVDEDDNPEPVWTGVGSDFTISTQGNPNSFDDNGFAMQGGHKYAIFRTVELTGSGPNPLSNTVHGVYRFLISTTTASNAAAALAPANFTQIVGVTPGLFVENVLIGKLTRLVPSNRNVEVRLSSADVDAEGWVDVKAAVNRTMTAHPDFSPADLSDPSQDWTWDDADAMIGLNTVVLTNEEAHHAPAGLNAGDDYPNGSKFPIERVAIRFEIKDRNTNAILPGNGITLNNMVVNNSAPVLRTALKNSLGVVGACQKFTQEDVFYAYTLYHPHLGKASLRVKSNDNTYVFAPPVFVDNVPNPGIDEVRNANLMLSPRPDHTCTYWATLTYNLLRHNGEGAEEAYTPSMIFYFEA